MRTPDNTSALHPPPDQTVVEWAVEEWVFEDYPLAGWIIQGGRGGVSSRYIDLWSGLT